MSACPTQRAAGSSVAAVAAATAVCAVLLSACAGAPDRFFTLTPTPPPAHSGPAMPRIQVRLNVTIPSIVDRSEMVVDEGTNRVMVLDHERWAAPLADQVTFTLARDIENRRDDVLIGERAVERQASPIVQLNVDLVRMSVSRNGQAVIDAHWRIVNEAVGQDDIGSERFTAAVPAGGYAALADAYSHAIDALAARLATAIRP